MAIRSLARPLAAAAALAIGMLHVSANATAEWLTVAPTCAPDSMQTVQFELTSKSGGYARAGRNPPLAYFCPVWNPDDFATQPTWKRLQLQYIDPNAGGGVKARLYQKHRVTGATKVIATATSTTSSIVNVVSGNIKGTMDFAVYGYYVTLDLTTTQLPVEAHMVMLVN